MRPSPRNLIVGTLIGMLTVLGVSTSAMADGTGTTIAFQETEATAPFDSPWMFTISVQAEARADEDGYRNIEIGPESGTVDVYVDGIAGAYATALPLQATGVAYFAQPSGQPLLAAGTHTLRAIFNPLAGSGLQTSQTQTPATFTIEPLTVVATISASMDASASEYPVITGALGGSSVDAWGGAPAGIWRFTVLDEAGVTVFEREVAVPGLSTAPTVVEVDSKLDRSTEYVVTGLFTPDPAFAQGLTVTQPTEAGFTSASASVGELLVSPVVVAWWVVAIAALVLVLLLGGVIWVVVWRRRRRRGLEAGAAATSAGDEAAMPETRADARSAVESASQISTDSEIEPLDPSSLVESAPR
jgi:hypothetical protein